MQIQKFRYITHGFEHALKPWYAQTHSILHAQKTHDIFPGQWGFHKVQHFGKCHGRLCMKEPWVIHTMVLVHLQNHEILCVNPWVCEYHVLIWCLCVFYPNIILLATFLWTLKLITLMPITYNIIVEVESPKSAIKTSIYIYNYNCKIA